MKVIITENQLKMLVENIVKEEYNIFDDPKVQVLLDYLEEKENKEYGFGNVEKIKYSYGLGFVNRDVYRLGKRKFMVVTDPPESDSGSCEDISRLGFIIDGHSYKNYCIFNLY